MCSSCRACVVGVVCSSCRVCSSCNACSSCSACVVGVIRVVCSSSVALDERLEDLSSVEKQSLRCDSIAGNISLRISAKLFSFLFVASDARGDGMESPVLFP